MTTMATNAAKKLQGMSEGRLYNFSAGPGTLPEEVLRQVQEDVWDLFGTGIGVLEHSHRGPAIDRVWEEAEADFRRVGGVPDSYRVLFLTGGASTQCFQVPANLLPQDRTADYLLTGKWAQDSVEAARMFGTINVAYSSADSNHDHVPRQEQIKFSGDPVYLQYTSNNTIFGTEFDYVPTPPNAGRGGFVVCDASSDIYSKPIDFTKYGLVYAGAQKNLGPAGTTIVVIRDDLLERVPREIPKMVQYRVHAKDGSRHNTPPVFPVYCVGLVLKWILKEGGLVAMEKKNRAKAKLIYDVLDGSSFFRPHARKDSRSLMNITFKCPSEDLDKKFLKEAQAAGMDGMKGHRSTGGMRASIYNAFPEQGCTALADFMKEFERRNG